MQKEVEQTVRVTGRLWRRQFADPRRGVVLIVDIAAMGQI